MWPDLCKTTRPDALDLSHNPLEMSKRLLVVLDRELGRLSESQGRLADIVTCWHA
jgi:hypothetical protein